MQTIDAIVQECGWSSSLDSGSWTIIQGLEFYQRLLDQVQIRMEQA